MEGWYCYWVILPVYKAEHVIMSSSVMWRLFNPGKSDFLSWIGVLPVGHGLAKCAMMLVCGDCDFRV